MSVYFVHLLQNDLIVVILTNHLHMCIASGCQKHQTRANRIAILCFSDLKITSLTQAIRIQRSKTCRHMLYHNNPRHIPMQSTQQFHGGLCPPRGSTDGNQIPLAAGILQLSDIDVRGSARMPANLRDGCNLNLNRQLRADKILQILPLRRDRFRHKINSSSIHGIKNTITEGTNHDNRQWILRH